MNVVVDCPGGSDSPDHGYTQHAGATYYFRVEDDTLRWRDEAPADVPSVVKSTTRLYLTKEGYLSSVNGVHDPAALLAVPTADDIAVMREILQDGYETVEDEYVRAESDDMDDHVATKGSLCQELMAQLSDYEEAQR